MPKPRFTSKNTSEILQEQAVTRDLKAKLNEDYEKALQNVKYNTENQIPKAPVRYKSIEEEIKDDVLQRETAKTNLLRITKDDDASRILTKLQASNEIIEFNRFFNIFFRDVKDIREITPVIFDTLWAKFKEKLLSTGNTGIFMEPQKDEYEAGLQQLSDSIRSELVSFRSVQEMVKAMEDRAIGLLNLNNNRLSDYVKDQYLKDEEKELFNGAVVKVPDATGKLVERKIEFKDDGEIRFQSGKSKFSTENAIQYLIFKEFQVPLGRAIYKSAKILGNISNNILKLISQKIESRRLIGKGVMVDSHPANQILSDKEYKTKNEPNLGNYFISLNQLKNGYLRVRYPSGSNVFSFPKKKITSDLKTIIQRIIFERQFEEEDYENLSEEEQKLFDDLLDLCSINRTKKSEFTDIVYKHKRHSDKIRDQDIKRFDLLKGQILAGNNNPDILKELKLLLLKMKDKKFISNSDFNRTIYDLMIILN
jgi:hypothetical protein